jgi:HK97 family phage prohead protease
MKHIVVPMEIKAVSATGAFSGYASMFGNKDLGGDIIVGPQPFKEIVRTRDEKVLVLYAHDSNGYTPSAGLPIGKADIEQNEKGLAFDGQLVMADPFVKERLHPHMKEGTLDGMSIGYDVLPGGYEYTYQGGEEVRLLRAMKLWEISVVTFGMNPEARIEQVKHRAKNVTNIREYEDLLRDVGGFSAKQAKRLASGGWAALSDHRDDEDLAQGLKGVNDLLTNIKIPTYGDRNAT